GGVGVGGGWRKCGRLGGGARDRGAQGVCCAVGDRGQPLAPCAATAHGKYLVVDYRRRARFIAGLLASGRDDGVQTADQHTALDRTAHRWTRAALYADRFDADGRDLWTVAHFAIHKTRSRSSVERRSFDGGVS